MKRRLCFLALTVSLVLEVLLEIGAREGWAPIAGSSERVASLRLALLLSALGLAGFLWFRSDRAQKDQKRIEALLEDADRAEAQVRLGTWALDPPFLQVRWSRGLYRLLGLSPDTPSGEETLHSRMDPEDVATLRSRVETLGLQGGSFHFEHPIHLPDGTVRVVRAVCEALEDPTGRVTRLFGTLQDITELRALGSELESSRQRLQFALEGAQDGLWDWDLVTGKTYFSPRYYTMLGYEPGEFPGTSEAWKTLLHPEDREEVLRTIAERLVTGESQHRVTFRARHKDGSWRWILGRGVVVRRDEEGNPLRMVGTNSDITELKETEHRLRESEERWQLAIQGTDEGIWDWDIPNRKAFFSHRFKAMLGYAPEELEDVPRSCLDRIHPEDLPLVARTLSDYFNHRREDYRVEHRMVRKDGKVFWVLARGQGLFDTAGRPLRIAGSLQDITDRRNHEETIAHQATHDALTGLPNRPLFLDRLDQALARAERTGERLGVLFMDLDHFKEINDHLGHLVGDRILAEVALRLKETLRAQDTVARMGGDEFTFLLPGLGRPEDAERAGGRILEAFRAPFVLEGAAVSVTASLGIALFPEHGTGTLDLMRRADLALYQAKSRGRNRYETANPFAE